MQRRLAMLILVVLAVLTAIVMVGVTPASACSCALVSDQDRFDRADVVFAGEVTGADGVSGPGGGGLVWTVQVDDVYKGEAAQTQGVVSAAETTACGLDLPQDGRVLIFAQRSTALADEQVDWPTLYSSLCSGSRPWPAEVTPGSWPAERGVPVTDADGRVVTPAVVPLLGVARPPSPGASGLPPDPLGGRALRATALVAGAALLAAIAVVTIRRRRST